MGVDAQKADSAAQPGAPSGRAPTRSQLYESESAAQTEALGGELARCLGGGDVVHLHGEIGAGKTTFIRGIARALGVRETVSSPTFVIAQRYRGERFDLAHIDLYRLPDPQAEEPELLGDYRDEQTVLAVEWPIEGALGVGERARFLVRIEDLGGERRRLQIVERS
jgi:tRNA threonylcarbamoyladenosine biosynthesis protein TsaE